MKGILKWGRGFILANALTITPLFFLLQYESDMVEDSQSSTILPYEMEEIQSVVVVEKELNELIINYPISDPLTNREKIVQFNKSVEEKKEEIKKQKEEAIKLNILKAKQERLLKEKQEKEKIAKQSQMPSRGKATIDRVMVTATAYTAYCEGCSGTTFTGHNARKSITYNGMRIIATDRRVIPMYSIVRVRYDSIEFYAISLDIGGAIKGYKIDLLVGSKGEALNFGKRKVELEVVRYGK